MTKLTEEQLAELDPGDIFLACSDHARAADETGLPWVDAPSGSGCGWCNAPRPRSITVQPRGETK